MGVNRTAFHRIRKKMTSQVHPIHMKSRREHKMNTGLGGSVCLFACAVRGGGQREASLKAVQTCLPMALGAGGPPIGASRALQLCSGDHSLVQKAPGLSSPHTHLSVVSRSVSPPVTHPQCLMPAHRLAL
jgi:hypothetical protein